MLKKFLHISIIIFIFAPHAYATFEAQYKNLADKEMSLPNKAIGNPFYLIGDAGLSPINGISEGLNALNKHLKTQKQDKSDFTIFLVGTTYPSGLSKKKDNCIPIAENALDGQLLSVNGFEGPSIFIPGIHD